MNDAQWHTVELRRAGRSGEVALDNKQIDFHTPGSASNLNLGGNLFVGGMNDVEMQELAQRTSSVW